MEQHQQIVDAALICFKRFSVKKTTMDDVAEQAGISRQLLYQYFNGRQSLIDAAIFREIELMVDNFTKLMPKNLSLTDAVLQGSLEGMKLFHSHPLLTELFKNSTVYHLPAVILDSNQPVKNSVLKWWGPIFNNARKSGELDPNISDEDLMEWIMSIHYMFLLREELSDERQEQLLRTFLLPSIAPKNKT